MLLWVRVNKQQAQAAPVEMTAEAVGKIGKLSGSDRMAGWLSDATEATVAESAPLVPSEHPTPILLHGTLPSR